MAINGIKAYQMKSAIKEYVTSGPVFDRFNEGMQKAIVKEAKGIWLLEPKEILDQSLPRPPWPIS